jgi:hypothetical protein
MSYLYRPTPVFNPGPPRGIPLSGAVSGGEMRGYDGGVNWKGFFDAKRAALQGSPWIVRSGTMGSFLGQDGTDTIDTSSLPLAPIGVSNIDISPIIAPLPVDLYPMPAPISPSIAPFNPGPVSAAPSIVSSGGSVTAPGTAAAQAATPWGSIVSSLTSFGSSVVKAATGQPQINPAIAPVAPTTQQSLVAQAQSLQAQAAAIAASNPALAAQYTASANALLAQAGASGSSSFTSFLTGSTIIPGLPNIAVLGGGLLVVVVAIGAMKGGRGK